MELTPHYPSCTLCVIVDGPQIKGAVPTFQGWSLTSCELKALSSKALLTAVGFFLLFLLILSPFLLFLASAKVAMPFPRHIITVDYIVHMCKVHQDPAAHFASLHKRSDLILFFDFGANGLRVCLLGL